MTAGPTSQFGVGPIATVSVGEGMVEFGYVQMSMPAGSVNVILAGDNVSEYNPAYVTIHGQRLEVDFYTRTGDGSRFYKIAHFVNPLPFSVTYGDHVQANVSERQLPTPPLGLAPDGRIVQIDSLTGGLLRLYVQPVSMCLSQNVRSIIVGDDTRYDPVSVIRSSVVNTSSGDYSCGLDVEIDPEQTFYVGDNVTVWATGSHSH